MNHQTPTQVTPADDDSALVRNIVYVALVPFLAFATFYAIAIASRTPLGGTSVAVTDASFVVSVMVSTILGTLSFRWAQQVPSHS